MHNRAALLAGCILVLLTLLIVPRPADAVPTSNLQQRLGPPEAPDLPPRLPEAVRLTMAAPETPDLAPVEMAAWSRLVFQSYRNSAWHIYGAFGDGSGPYPLTDSGAPNVRPRYNRDASRLAFASGRTGNYDIYVMNADGSGLAQLTSQAAADYNPVWSPDGTRLAFSSLRDGQSEIYVMKADGSAPTRLTFDAEFDGEPAWSPDGSKIAFTSTRTGGYAIWIMNADGSGQTLLAAQPYSENAAWSPDGSQIAYDCDGDGDGDGWQEVWVMTAAGGNQHLAYKSWQSATDVYARSWSPDGQYIAVTRVTWVYYNGNWYWMYAYLGAWDTVTGGEVSLSSQGEDWYPDWRTTDVSAPWSTVKSLPVYSRASGASINWLGADIGLAGIKNYDVQYRLGTGGSWTNWLTTNQPGASYSGPGGATIYFRSRARDNALNLEAWPGAPDGDAFTTLYRQQFNGRVSDSRGEPLPHVAVPVAPAALNAAGTDRAGRFTAYLSFTGTYAFSPIQPGYGLLPTTTLTASADQSVDLNLPPIDDLIQNGGFETGSMAGWETIGITPTANALAAHTGQFGARLGQAFLRPPAFTVSADPSGAWSPSLAYDVTGTLHLVWVDRTASRYLHYASCTPAHICQSAALPLTGARPKIAVGPDGVVHLIFIATDDVTILYANLAGGVWSAPQTIGTSTDWYNGHASIAVDAQSRPHVVWNNARMIYYSYRQANAVWSPAVQIGGSGVQPVIAISNNGDIHVAWSNGYAGDWTAYRRKPAGGAWEDSVNLYQGYYATSPAIAVDQANQPHIAWLESLYPAHVIYTHRNGDGTWTPPTSIPESRSTDLMLAVRSDNVVIAVWDAGRYFTYLFPDGSTWSPVYQAFDPNWAAPDYGWTALALRPGTEDVTLATFAPVTGPWLMYAAEFRLPVEQAASSRLRQTVSIPMDLWRPTLSLHYQYSSEEDTATEPFSLTVDDGQTVTTLLTRTTSIGWTPAWFDLSSWAGQTVTLTLDVSATLANGRYSWAAVDELSLGAYLTPLPRAVVPKQMEAGASAVITITGDNFLAVPQVQIGGVAALDVHWIDTATLTATLPALTPGQYEVRVINPGGQLNAAPRNLIVGRVLYLSTVFR